MISYMITKYFYEIINDHSMISYNRCYLLHYTIFHIFDIINLFHVNYNL